MMPRTSPVPTGRPSFLAAPRCADLDLLDADVAVLGVPYTTPCDLVASRSRSSEAPGAVREQSLSLAGRLTHYDFDFGGDLWAHFPHGQGTSRLAAAMTPARAGGVGTWRNWNTLRRIGDLLAG